MITLKQDGKTFLLTRVRLSEGQFTGFSTFKREIKWAVKWAVTGKALREAVAKPVRQLDTLPPGYVRITLERTLQNKTVPRNARTVKVKGFSACAAERCIGCTKFSAKNWKLILKTLGVK